jgi:cytochrome bd-type quinol oxidase subunit 1
MRTPRQNKIFQLAMFTFMILVAMSSCHGKRYKYKITGTVNTKSGAHDAIWYTDTFNIDTADVMVIMNSNGSYHRIQPPYIIYALKN